MTLFTGINLTYTINGINMHTKSTGTYRSSYPFYTNDGIRTLVTDAVDDLVLWIDPSIINTVLPITVTPSVESDILTLKFTGVDQEYVVNASEGVGELYTPNMVLSGYIKWNDIGLRTLKNTLLGNDPQPYNTVYIDPFVCVPRFTPPLSTISINNNLVPGYVPEVTISQGRTITVNEYDDTYSIDIVPGEKEISDSLSDTEKYVGRLVILDSNGDTAVDVEVNGHVWLKAEAQCDIRVVTTNEILITEIANDKLQ